MKNRLALKAFVPLIIPIAGFYSSIVESCPVGISYQDCAGCHFGGTFSYSASWSSIPTVMERNTTDTVTFSMSGSGASEGGFSAITDLGTFTATAGETNISSTNVSHSTPGGLSWSFTFNSGGTSGTASLDAYGNPVDGNRTATSNANPLCDGGANGTTGTSGDGNSGSSFPTASTLIVVNDSPSISAGGGNASFTESGAAATVAPLLSLTDTENSATEIQSGSITITTNYSAADGDVLNINGTTCTANNLVCSGSGTQTITISGGPESTGEFQNVLRAVTFSNSSLDPDTSARTVQFSVTDQYSRVRTDTRNVLITAVNDPPVITEGATESVSMSEDGSPTPFSLTLNATDPEGDTLTWDILTQPAVGTGTATASGTGTSKSIGYIPPMDYTGSASFVVRVTDDGTGLLTDTITVDVTVNPVNDPPVITEGASIGVAMSEDGSPIGFSLILNATDTENDPITWSIGSAASNGTAGASGTGNSTSVSYSPNLNFNGSDSFVVNATSAALTDSITVNVTISAVNDPPALSAIADQTATESVLFSFDAGTVFSDPEDANNGADITWDFQSGQQAGMTISNLGLIEWTPPQTGTFNQSYGPVVVRATDGEPSSGTTSFNIIVSPPDADSDNVADYNDLCLTVADSTNADNDGDGTPGSDGGVNDGGDVCDLDDDNDGMPDTFENAYGLDPFDSADASEDADGDGATNLEEFLAGTSPTIADEIHDATGYLTPVAITPPAPTTINAAAVSIVATSIDLNGVTLNGFDPLGPYRPGRNEITWTAFDSGNNNIGTSVQTLTIRPLLNFTTDQQVGEGSTVTVNASLNGVAASYPVTVNYTVSGTADASDHDAVDGSFVFNDPDQASNFTFDVSSDTIPEGEETVVFTVTSASNAAIGSGNTHVVTIVEGNIMPQVELSVSQNSLAVGSAYVSEGAVTVAVTINDANSSQTHSLDWSLTDNSLSAPADSTTLSWNFTPVAGNFLIEVNVTDNGSPALSNRVSRVLNIAANAPTLLNTDDSDNDGIDDLAEGLGDNDADGIPDYLDANTESNLLPNQTVNLVGQYILETEPGLSLSLGNTTMAANNFGVLVSEADIESFGSSSGGAPLNADDGFEHVGGVYDFEISGLVPGESASIVIPLEISIPNDAVYRKFDASTGWRDFTVDTNNRVASAPGEPGACPEPGSSLYIDGLNLFDNCLQLTIVDGGPNDLDGVSNGVIKDPGSVGVELEDPETPSVKKGGGYLHPWMLIVFVTLGGLLIAIQRKRKVFELD